MPEDINCVMIEQSKFECNYYCLLSFKLNPRQDEIRTVCIEFEEDFIADYFHIPGNNNDYAKKLREVANKNRNFLFRLGLIKIEERINDQSLVKNIQVSVQDMSWAEKIGFK